MSERKAVTKHLAQRYQSANKAVKTEILDHVVELTSWHCDHARAALRRGRCTIASEIGAARKGAYLPGGSSAVPDPVLGGAAGPAGKLLAAATDYLVPMLRAEHVLDVTDEQARLLVTGERGDHRPPPGRRTPEDGPSWPLPYQARIVVEVPDPDPDLG